MMDWSATIQASRRWITCAAVPGRSRRGRPSRPRPWGSRNVLKSGPAGALARSWLGGLTCRPNNRSRSRRGVHPTRHGQVRRCRPRTRAPARDAGSPIRSGASTPASRTPSSSICRTSRSCEQARICRRGGRVIAMMTLPEKSLTSMPGGWPATTERAGALGSRRGRACRRRQRGVGSHWPSPAGLWALRGPH